MIDLSAFKKSLGPLANKLSEKEILEVREHQDRLAEVFFDMWLNDTKKKKNELQYKHGKG